MLLAVATLHFRFMDDSWITHTAHHLKKTNHCYDDDIRATAATGTTCPDQGAQILRRNCAGKRWWEIQDSIKSSLSLWARQFTWQISLRSSLVSTHTQIYPTYSRILVIFGKSLVVIFQMRLNVITTYICTCYVHMYIYIIQSKKKHQPLPASHVHSNPPFISSLCGCPRDIVAGQNHRDVPNDIACGNPTTSTTETQRDRPRCGTMLHLVGSWIAWSICKYVRERFV